MSEQIKKYLRQLQEALSPAPPISVENLKSLHAAQDYKGMVQLIKRSMNIEEVTFRVLWVPDGVADEEHKDAPAWVRLPANMPFYGTRAFKEMTIEMCFRKSFLKFNKYDQAAIVIAHELSHVVLDSIAHPLRRVEKAVDLTAMLLGFRHLYASGAHKEIRSPDGMHISSQTIGYLSAQEIRDANQILEPGYKYPKFAGFSVNKTILYPLAAVAAALVALFAGRWLYNGWQLHQRLLVAQANYRLASPGIDVRVGFITWTSTRKVPTGTELPSTWAREVRKSTCATPKVKEMIAQGAFYVYEYRDTSGALVGRFEISSCLS